MKETMQNYKIFWEKTTSDNAKILRFYSNQPIADIPAKIAGYPVTELGNYCFSTSCKLPNTYRTIDTAANSATITELCGNYLNSVQFPDSLEKIGDYAFYNCKNLSRIICSSKLRAIGSDAFMNCHHLRQIFFRCSPKERTGLRQMLTQIFWDIEVFFLGNLEYNSQNISSSEAVLFYPEYYESYDEIAPAHIFGRKIIGEGFRSRQCFQNGFIDFPQYDKIFAKACVEETPQVLCKFAFYRLRYPYHLLERYKIQYQTYIFAHGDTLCHEFVTNKKLHDLLFLLQSKLLSPQNMQYALTLATQTGWSEGSAEILRCKQLQNQTHPYTRYTFDDF